MAWPSNTGLYKAMKVVRFSAMGRGYCSLMQLSIGLFANTYKDEVNAMSTVEIIRQFSPTRTNTPNTYTVRILKLLIRLRYLIYYSRFLFLFSFFLRSLRESSLAQTAYDKHEFHRWLLPSLFRSYRDQVYRLFSGGLTSKYQVVGNQRTPLVIVQIVLDLVTSSPL